MPHNSVNVGLAAIQDRVLLESAPYHDHRLLGVLVREAAIQAGLGKKDLGVPFADIIEPGMSVLLKPNWVLHHNEGGYGMECMITHPEFLLAALQEVLKAKPGKVSLADAPLQSCIWDQVVSEEMKERALALAVKSGARLEFIDFRRTVAPTGRLEQGVRTDLRDESNYVRFDLGKDSLLEKISTPEGRFRVTCYDPEKLARTHRPGRHQYLLCREAFATDVVISMPKLKLHRKAGITAALKNLVGINGNKDYLPHHRLGGAASGGDCYQGNSLLKRTAEFLVDQANRRLGTPLYPAWSKWAHGFKGIVIKEGEGGLEGSWYGNDTCWRMVLDLNRILIYGKADGTLSDEPQRTLWSLTDAIVCGQGEGPLAPQPVAVGVVTFSGSAAAADAAHCALLGMDDQRIPLVREARGQFRWPLTPMGAQFEFRFRNRRLDLEDIARELGVRAKAPVAWAGHIERETIPSSGSRPAVICLSDEPGGQAA